MSQIEQLVKQAERIHDSPLNDDAWEYGNCIRNVLQAIAHENAIVHFDDPQKYNEYLKKNETFRAMVKRAEQSEEYAPKNCDNYIPLNADNADLNAMYFVMDGDDIAVHKGIFALTPTKINNPLLYKDFGDGDIEKGKPRTWSMLLKNALHSCNALIAVDNFLYKGRTNNLFPILDSLLPEHLPNGLPFQISLFMLEEPGVELEKIYNQIMDHFHGEKGSRKELSIDLTIYKCSTAEFHDRAIITNSMWIGCEGGFDLLKKDKYGLRTISTKLTKTHLTCPFLQSKLSNQIDKIWSRDSYALLLQDAEIARKKERELKGPNKNRLFDQLPKADTNKIIYF